MRATVGWAPGYGPGLSHGCGCGLQPQASLLAMAVLGGRAERGAVRTHIQQPNNPSRIPPVHDKSTSLAMQPA